MENVPTKCNIVLEKGLEDLPLITEQIGQFFNGKIAPVIPYGIRGAIWCQGTSNSGDGRIYAARMEALIKGWRDAWGMPEMPFYFTQMQPYGSPDPDNVGFADIRQVQHLFFQNNREWILYLYIFQEAIEI